MGSLDDDDDALAYRAGREAYLSGRSVDDNPFNAGDLVHSMWEAGYQDAENGSPDASQVDESP